MYFNFWLSFTIPATEIIYLFAVQDHTRFVQAVRCAPTGSHFASGGFYGKVFLYDGVSADLVGEIGSPAHKGGVYAVSISFQLEVLKSGALA